MRTLIVSDLHLGANAGNDVLRRPEHRRTLIDALREHEVQRLVVCGDGVELREVPAHAAASHLAPLLEAAGEQLGAHGEIVLLAGNHDHPLLNGWLEARRMSDAPPMALQETIAATEAGPIVAQLARHTGPAALSFAYPGLFVREDVYATHGHYLDLHTTVPTMERLAAGAMARFIAPIPERATPDDYEATLAPLYAWVYVIAQRATDAVSGAGRRGSTNAYRVLTGEGGSRVRRAAMRGSFAAAVQAVNRVGLGPVEPRLSAASLRRGSLVGMGEVVRRLGVEAEHVVFGHSHRHGPVPGDDPAEWRAPTGAQLHNTGSWVYQPHFLGPVPERSPYRPGTAVLVEETGPPRLLQVLRTASHADLAPPGSPLPPAGAPAPDPDAPAG